MIREAARNSGLSFESPAEIDEFVEARAAAAEEQFRSAMAEIPEEAIRERNRMQREDPAMGAAQWMTRYESSHAEAALIQAFEMPKRMEPNEP